MVSARTWTGPWHLKVYSPSVPGSSAASRSCAFKPIVPLWMAARRTSEDSPTLWLIIAICGRCGCAAMLLQPRIPLLLFPAPGHDDDEGDNDDDVAHSFSPHLRKLYIVPCDGSAGGMWLLLAWWQKQGGLARRLCLPGWGGGYFGTSSRPRAPRMPDNSSR